MGEKKSVHASINSGARERSGSELDYLTVFASPARTQALIVRAPHAPFSAKETPTEAIPKALPVYFLNQREINFDTEMFPIMVTPRAIGKVKISMKLM